MEGTARGGKIKVRNLADSRIHEVKANTVSKVDVHAPAKKTAPPAAVRDLERSTQGLVNRTGERLGIPAPAAPRAAPSAPRPPAAPRPAPVAPLPYFEDVTSVDQATLGGHLAHESDTDVALALKGTHPEVREHVLGSLPADRRAAVEAEIIDQGPVRHSVVEAAQNKVLGNLSEGAPAPPRAPEAVPTPAPRAPAPAPSAPATSRSPNLPGGTRRRPVTPSAPSAPSAPNLPGGTRRRRPVTPPNAPSSPAGRGANLPGRKSGEDLAVGHQFHAKSADGKSVQLTVSGKSKRADGGHTVLGTDAEGNSHRVVVPAGSSVRTVRPGLADHKPDTANVPEPPAHPKPPGASGGNEKLDDLEATAAKNGEIVLYHGGLPEGTSLDDIQLSRAGTQQNKKGRSYGGFYLTDSGSKDWSTDYAKGRNGVMHGFRVSKDAKVGDLGGKNIDRLSNEERASLAEQYDVVKGKDTLGRDQYVLLNKDAIAGVGETNVGTGRTGNVGTQAASGALVAADDGGPAQRISSDYGYKAKKGRKVATEAGAKRYGLPIGTPLGKGNRALASDSATAKAYETFMAANTPADLNKAAGWMSNDDLAKASKGLFSFDSTNERDQAGRIALVKELAARGIDPHSFGYKGGPVVLNPNPKQDPVAKAADTAQKKADTAQKKADSAAAKAAKAVQQTQVQAQKAQAQADKDAIAAQSEASRKLVQQAHDALAQDIASGKITEKEARQRMAVLK